MGNTRIDLLVGISIENGRFVWRDRCTIRATSFKAPITVGPGRGLVMPETEAVQDSEQTVAWLNFQMADGSPKFGVFDWTGEVYRSYIRATRLLVRGERGEIVDTTVRYLEDPATPVEYTCVHWRVVPS
jgi:hypothetical protein